jgi:hypothetical protein
MQMQMAQISMSVIKMQYTVWISPKRAHYAYLCMHETEAPTFKRKPDDCDFVRLATGKNEETTQRKELIGFFAQTNE